MGANSDRCAGREIAMSGSFGNTTERLVVVSPPEIDKMAEEWVQITLFFRDRKHGSSDWIQKIIRLTTDEARDLSEELRRVIGLSGRKTE